jgi:ABC-type lipoprotein release transport system permease subunit
MTHLLRIAWRNVGRNPRRSVLSALAVGFAVGILVFAMAMQQGSYADMIFNTVHARTGNLQIQHPGYWPNANLAQSLRQPEAFSDVLKDIPEVRAFAPRVQAAALLSSASRTFGALVQGIDPAREADTSTLADVVRQGAYLSPDDHDGALVGELLAKNLDVAIGDEIVFLGQGADGSLAAGKLVVRGLFKTGIAEMDRSSVAAHIEPISDAFSMRGGVTEIAVLLDRDDYRESVTARIRKGIAEKGRREDAAVVPWTTLMPGVEESIRLDWYSAQIIYLVLVFVVGFGIANTFLMAYMERIHEFGVLLSLGMKPSRLSWMVYAESCLLTLVGVAAGLIIGIPVTQYFHHHGIYFGEGTEELMAEYGMSATIHPLIKPMVLQLAVGIVLAVTLILAIYPAWKASRLLPVEAMRHR